jgi:hypothetical protein
LLGAETKTTLTAFCPVHQDYKDGVGASEGGAGVKRKASDASVADDDEGNESDDNNSVRDAAVAK